MSITLDTSKGASNGSSSKKPWFLVGVSPAISKLRELAPTLARAKVPIMLLGETGVGKTALASRLHGDRPGHLVSVNCASLTDAVATSEIFGNVRGAFTGALGSDGLLHSAHEGTLFLDEVASLSPAVQAMFLTPLDDGHYRRVGTGVLSYSSARFLCATNSDPDSLVRDGGFREDLLFRLAKIRLTIPPLRERMEDVPLLIDRALDGTSTTIDASAKSRLIEAAREFRGNIRQLFGVLEVAVAFASDGVVSLDNPIFDGSFLTDSNLDLSSPVVSATSSHPSVVLSASAPAVAAPLAPQLRSLTPHCASSPLTRPQISPADLSAAVDALNPYADLKFSGRGLDSSSYEKLASKIPNSTAADLREYFSSLKPLIFERRRKLLSTAVAEGADSAALLSLTGLIPPVLYAELSKYSLTLKKPASPRAQPSTPAIEKRIPPSSGLSLESFLESLGNSIVLHVEEDEIRSFLESHPYSVAKTAVSSGSDFLTPFRKRQKAVVVRALGFSDEPEVAARNLRLSSDRFTRLCAILDISLSSKTDVEIPPETFDRITAFIASLKNPFELSLKSDRSGLALDPDSAQKVAAALGLDLSVVVKCSRLNSSALQTQVSLRRRALVSKLHEEGVSAKVAISSHNIPEGMLKRSLDSLGITFGAMGTKTFTPVMVCEGDSLTPTFLDLLNSKVAANPFEIPILSRSAGEPALKYIAREYLKNDAIYSTLVRFDGIIFALIRNARIRFVNSETEKGKSLDQVAKELKQTTYSLEVLLDLV